MLLDLLLGVRNPTSGLARKKIHNLISKERANSPDNDPNMILLIYQHAVRHTKIWHEPLPRQYPTHPTTRYKQPAIRMQNMGFDRGAPLLDGQIAPLYKQDDICILIPSLPVAQLQSDHRERRGSCRSNDSRCHVGYDWSVRTLGM